MLQFHAGQGLISDYRKIALWIIVIKCRLVFSAMRGLHDYILSASSTKLINMYFY